MVPSNTDLNNTEFERLDTRDTEDTRIVFKLEKSSNSLTDQERERMKKEYEEKAFYGNDDHVPERIAHVLKVYSKSIEEAEAYYKIILTAKKKAEKDIDQLIYFEHEPKLVHKVVDAFVRSVRKIERESVNNPGGYIYKTIYDLIMKEKGHSLFFSNERGDVESKIQKEIRFALTGEDS